MGELDPRARDLVIRTVLGEAANEPDEGMAAVAAVIRNRVQSGRFGGSVPEVVLKPKQFEPWNTPDGRSRMYGYAPDSEPYSRAARAVDSVFAQGSDPTSGATHFYSPTAQAALGREPPKWAQGEPQNIGRHAFYAPEGRVAQNTGLPAGFVLDDAPQQAGGLPAGFVLDDEATPASPVDGRSALRRAQDVPDPTHRTAQEMPAQAPPTAMQRVLEPITSYPATQRQMARDGYDRMTEGASQAASAIAAPPAGTDLQSVATGNVPKMDPSGRWDASRGQSMADTLGGAGKAVMGGLEYALSPVNAALRTVIGKPVEDATGIPKEIPEIAASLMLPGGPVRAVATTKAAAAPTKAAEVVQAAERLGVDVPRAVASDSRIMQPAGRMVQNVPLAGEPMRKAAEGTIAGLGTKADEVAQGLGGGTVQGAGDTARTAIKDWITGESKAKVGKAYDAVDKLVDPAIRTPLSATQGMVATITAERSNAALPGGGKAADVVMEAVQRPGGLNYEGVKTLRTNVGEMLKGGILPEGMSQGELKRIYGALSDDLGTAVRNAGGPKAEAAWERANKYNALVADRREQLAKIVGKDGDAPAEKVFDALAAKAGSTARADIEALAKARKVMDPAEWNEFASGVVTRLGRDPEGKFSPDRFVTAYGKMTEAGKSLLFRSGGRGDLAQHLDDIATVSSRFKELQKYANPSGTAQNATFGAMGAGLIAAPMTTISTVIGANALARVLSQPATAASAAKLARTQLKLVTNPSPANVAAYTVASRNFATTLESIGVPANSNDFLKALQGPVRGAAEEEQR
jgi:hypothetical protein